MFPVIDRRYAREHGKFRRKAQVSSVAPRQFKSDPIYYFSKWKAHESGVSNFGFSSYFAAAAAYGAQLEIGTGAVTELAAADEAEYGSGGIPTSTWLILAFFAPKPACSKMQGSNSLPFPMGAVHSFGALMHPPRDVVPPSLKQQTSTRVSFICRTR